MKNTFYKILILTLVIFYLVLPMTVMAAEVVHVDDHNKIKVAGVETQGDEADQNKDKTYEDDANSDYDDIIISKTEAEIVEIEQPASELIEETDERPSENCENVIISDDQAETAEIEEQIAMMIWEVDYLYEDLLVLYDKYYNTEMEILIIGMIEEAEYLYEELFALYDGLIMGEIEIDEIEELIGEIIEEIEYLYERILALYDVIASNDEVKEDEIETPVSKVDKEVIKISERIIERETTPQSSVTSDRVNGLSNIAQVPKTGDMSKIRLWIVLLFASMTGVGCLLHVMRRRIHISQ